MKDLNSIIKKIQITEKGTALTEKNNKYFFRVDPAANKIEIKQAVEKFFKVSVAQVNTMRYTGKMKRNRSWRMGRKTDWKRAVVTLKEGSKIEMT
jgi:large subunit ribosomal protein L23